MNRHVLYISKTFKQANIDTNKQSLFPFLKSKLFDTQSKKKLSFNKIDAICNSTNINDFLKKRKQCKSFIFFGRSNVGKSSLINQLINASVNQTSKQPGKTKQLAFLKLNTNQLTYFVDAPGYGYASAASKQQIKKWGKLVQIYLKNTPNTQNQQSMILLDITHGIKNVDIMLLDMLQHYKKNFIIIFTKVDKATQQQIKQSKILAEKLQEKYQQMNFFVHYTSSRKQEGIQQLRNHILFKILTI